MALFCSPSPLPHESERKKSFDYGKRKLEESVDVNSAKRTKFIGPFILDESDEEDVQRETLQSKMRSSITRQDSWLDTPETRTNRNVETFRTDPLPAEAENNKPLDQALPSIAGTESRRERVTIRKCSGKSIDIQRRKLCALPSYEQLIASRSITAPGRAAKSYYGVEIHRLLEEAQIYSQSSKKSRCESNVHPSVESPADYQSKKAASVLWTEKYRARRFKDLIGDDRTHRAVLRWLKGWDAIVFPGLVKSKAQSKGTNLEAPAHRKILLLTGPPGLGKTTLAHVCAKQAGYEVLEINASDERSRDVVKGRIKDAVGTENVKGITVEADGRKIRKPGRPVCVVVDEVDGVVGGAAGGEGGFMKALIELVMLDQKNSNIQSPTTSTSDGKKRKKGNNFRLLRPLILICNDVYHPSLRPLRTSSVAEIVHVRQVPLEQVVQRMRHVFEKEGISCDGDAVRRICEASWGLSAIRDRRGRSRGINEGDIRGVLVAGEWIARKLRYGGSSSANARLTRKWVEQHILGESSKDGSIPGLGRGGTKEIVERVFIEGAGFPYDRVGTDNFKGSFARAGIKPVGVADLRKRHAMNRLREMVDATGEYDRCVTDCFLAYPTQGYQDDTFLSKPNAAYEWLYFHDLASSKIHSNQYWELNPYLSQSIIAFHHLFSSLKQPSIVERKHDDNDAEHPFSGSRADFAAFEAEKQNRAILTEFRSSLSAPLLRTFLSPGTITMELVPSLTRMLAPDINPVVVGGSGSERGIASVRKETEKALVQSAIRVMNGLGVTFERTRVEVESGIHSGWIYRMEPALDCLTSFSKVKGTSITAAGSSAPVRYAVRQVLDQEYRKDLLKRQAEARQARYSAPTSSATKKSNPHNDNSGRGSKEDPDAPTKISRLNGPKRDFFGRIIANIEPPPAGENTKRTRENKNQKIDGQNGQETKVWVSFHEGFSNAVRKRITMRELLSGL
ncbi:Chromosome transmission fidelity protein 18 [Emydomyces testavorans]|uniref:Chromosome transmission fidelity protein 18 n=1 Tax=Emydomyces testavorans TaxID=2070801 RepID=A0AAF0DF50_9EURO|nr:Chromosome transmission fidelity protein 18 [Emydomyces testavorans]